MAYAPYVPRLFIKSWSHYHSSGLSLVPILYLIAPKATIYAKIAKKKKVLFGGGANVSCRQISIRSWRDCDSCGIDNKFYQHRASEFYARDRDELEFQCYPIVLILLSGWYVDGVR